MEFVGSSKHCFSHKLTFVPFKESEYYTVILDIIKSKKS